MVKLLWFSHYDEMDFSRPDIMACKANVFCQVAWQWQLEALFTKTDALNTLYNHWKHSDDFFCKRIN